VAPARRLRLTRRGRAVLVLLPAVLALSSAFVGMSAPFAQADPTASSRTVVVRTGDTLWAIAERVAPARDPRDVVAALERANHLAGAVVLAGSRLEVPADASR
jgi:Tfp pilus assembly protein FimV